MAYKEDYGNKKINQPGGGPNAKVGTIRTVTNPERSARVVTQPCRLGPAKPGGNPPRNLNPFK